jgi:hypothetical protein
VVVVVSFLFFFPFLSCKNRETQMNESCAKSRYDHPLFTFLFASVGPTERCSLENFGGP